MKKTLVCILLAAVLLVSCAYGESQQKDTTQSGTGSTGWGSFGSLEMQSFEGFPDMQMPSMEGFPEMPSFDTSSWGEFKMPEGWGDMSFDGFSGFEGFQGFGQNSDWASSFEDMKKQMENGFGNFGGSSKSDDWPPASFKDMEAAFNEQKSGMDTETGSGRTEDAKSLFEGMFGDTTGNAAPDAEIPPLDFAQENLNSSLPSASSSMVNQFQSVLNMNTINNFIASTSAKVGGDASADNLGSMPSLGTVGGVNMKSSYESLSSKLAPKMDETKKYDGSLYK